MTEAYPTNVRRHRIFKINIKVLVSSLLLLASWMNIIASPLTPEQALNRIKSSSSAKRISGATSFVLAHTEKLNNQDYLFVFNRNNDGFIIASADDRMPALLGYSDNGAFDLATASPELKWWLGQYALQASQNLDSYISTASEDTPARADRANISPLIQTHWAQGNPYNLKCPEDAKGRSVTGCVATAMAQVIKYHGCPSEEKGLGKGTNSYNWNETTLTYDYNNASFDFGNMLNTYDANATQAEMDAVAELMYACGVGVNMKYTSTESGAIDAYVASALKNYFNYDAGIRYLMPDFFTNDEWEEMVYQEVKEGRPVIYGGRGTTGGHEFICDGYNNENGFFHINWGWGGLADGYFSLSALNPPVQGTGGTQYAYNDYQTMICGIQPNNNNRQSWYPLYSTAGIAGTDIYNNSEIFITFIENKGVFNDDGVFNYSPEPITTKFYTKIISDSETGPIYSEGKEMTFKGYGSGYVYFWLKLPTGLSQGDYKLGVVFDVPNGDKQNLPIQSGMKDDIEISVDDKGKVKLKNEPTQKPSIEVTNFSPNTDVIRRDTTEFKISINNTGYVGYYGHLFVRIFNTENNKKLAEYKLKVDLSAQDKATDASIKLILNLPAGDYNIQCFDMFDAPISKSSSLKILPSPSDPQSISLDSNEHTLRKGETFTITPTIMPETAADAWKTWSSSNTNVATVDQNGIVTAVGVGKAIITVTTGLTSSSGVVLDSGKIDAQCNITCYPKTGDANWDGKIDISDAVDISNYVLEIKTAPSDWVETEWKQFYIEGANANGSEDGKITFADACAAVSLALDQPAPASTQNPIRAAYDNGYDSIDALVIGNYISSSNGVILPITLDNSNPYVALQADIEVPEGMKLEDVKIGSRAAATHSITTRRIDDSHMRVALFDIANSIFDESHEPILELIVDNNHLDSDLIVVSNIIASDAGANGYLLASRYSDESGIDLTPKGNIEVQTAVGNIHIVNAAGHKINIYSLDGKILKSFVAPSDSEYVGLSSGVYIVKIGDKTHKIVM